MKHSSRISTLLALSFATLFASATVTADEVQIPIGQQGEAAVERPPRGVNKTQVENVYGTPQAKHGPTGNPPIYTWEYPEYTVYFEGDHVIHTVLKHRGQE